MLTHMQCNRHSSSLDKVLDKIGDEIFAKYSNANVDVSLLYQFVESRIDPNKVLIKDCFGGDVKRKYGEGII